MDFLQPLQVIWDYLGMHQEPQKADCIVGFGNFNDNIARRAAQLYHQGYADRILFTGGLGRNTRGLLPETEAARFARVAEECGVPGDDILREDRSTNTKENILFTREMLERLELKHERILGVHQPFMERRICAAMGVYWPEQSFRVTSPPGHHCRVSPGGGAAGHDPGGLHQRHRWGLPADGSVCQTGLPASSGDSGAGLGGFSSAC